MYMREELDIVGGELKEILQTKCGKIKTYYLKMHNGFFL